MTATTPGTAPAAATWSEAVAGYRRPRLAASIWQLANTLVPYLPLWALMIWSLGVSYWITLALAVPVTGLLMRVFIIFHDCGHQSFFRSRRANAIVEFITGVLTFTPYRQWRHSHAMHHASAGNLDRRGTGDVWTLTAREYLEAGLQGSSYYRLPGLLQWFTGNIGFHDMHHLSPSIPNYHLARCHRENAVSQDVRPITPAASMRSLRLHLWDEESGALVGYEQMRAIVGALSSRSQDPPGRNDHSALAATASGKFFRFPSVPRAFLTSRAPHAQLSRRRITTSN